MTGKGLGLLVLAMFAFFLLYTMVAQLSLQQSISEYNRAHERSQDLGLH